MSQKRGQFSLEYMMVIAFVLVLFLPVMVLLLTNSTDSELELSRLKINVLANNIIDESKVMYYSGGYSKRSIKYILPERVVAFYLTGENNEQLVFKMETPLGKRDFVYFSEIPLRFPFQITEEQGAKLVNLNTIYLINDEKGVLICTNLNIEGDCSGLAEDQEPAVPIP